MFTGVANFSHSFLTILLGLLRDPVVHRHAGLGLRLAADAAAVSSRGGLRPVRSANRVFVVGAVVRGNGLRCKRVAGGVDIIYDFLYFF